MYHSGLTCTTSLYHLGEGVQVGKPGHLSEYTLLGFSWRIKEQGFQRFSTDFPRLIFHAVEFQFAGARLCIPADGHVETRGLLFLSIQYANTKQKNLQDHNPAEHGDCYLWLALDAARKAIISYRVGKRAAEDANRFVADLRGRVVNRLQIITDAYLPYEAAVAEAFGGNVDYVMLNKKAGNLPVAMRGRPDLEQATTNHIERQNLTIRMPLRWCARRTNAHSKKFGPHQAAISLHIAFYNWCRVHETLRVTPTMKIGLTDHVWSIAELIQEAEGAPLDPTPLPAPPFFPRPGRRPFQLRVIPGGRIS